MSSSDKVPVKYPDDDVCRRVSSFLHSRHFPAFRKLQVEVSDGSVTLSGQVYSYYEKQVAITSCQHVAGVKDLVDRIVVLDSRQDEPVRPTRKRNSLTLVRD